MKFYTPTQLAKKYKVSRQSIHNWLNSGKLPFETLDNRQKIIAETDLPTFIREGVKHESKTE